MEEKSKFIVFSQPTFVCVIICGVLWGHFLDFNQALCCFGGFFFENNF